MMHKKISFLFLLIVFSFNSAFSQRFIGEENISNLNRISNDSLSSGETKVILSGKTKYTDYKIFSHKRDTTYVDTTLNIK